jgi:hypothetical protein
MRVPDEYKKTVAFLFVDGVDQITGNPIKAPIGTAFFVELNMINVPSIVYAVTALHVIRGAYGFETIYMRLNQIDGTTQDYSIPVDK